MVHIIKKRTLKELWNVHRKALRSFSGNPNLTGLDLGFKYIDNQRTDDICLRFHIKRKLNKDQISEPLFPTIIDSIHTDVIQANYVNHWINEGYYRFNPERLKEFDVIQPGISIGSDLGTSGTLGLIVQNAKYEACILTAAHILEGRPGDFVHQPALPDSQSLKARQVARLLRKDLLLDAGIALIDPNQAFSTIQFGTHDIVSSILPFESFENNALIGTKVYKSGRTTDLTEGRIDGIGNYGVRFGVQIVPNFGINNPDIEISTYGDSGAIWYDGYKRGVCLNVKGEEFPGVENERAIGTALHAIFHFLAIELIQ